jgi:hypothetical protein
MNPGDLPPVIIIVVLAVLGASVAILRGPLGRALARRIEGNHATPELEQRVHELEARLAALEGEGTQVAELAERVDFAERLLAQHSRAEESPR